MKNEAKLQNIPTEGYEGGLIFDEMAIQEDLQRKLCETEFGLIGFVDSCEGSELNDKLMGCHSSKLTTHVFYSLCFWVILVFGFLLRTFQLYKQVPQNFIYISGK